MFRAPGSVAAPQMAWSPPLPSKNKSCASRLQHARVPFALYLQHSRAIRLLQNTPTLPVNYLHAAYVRPKYIYIFFSMYIHRTTIIAFLQNDA